MLNLSGLFEAVPVEELIQGENGLEPISVLHFRPVTRESIEAFMREFGGKVWELSIKRTGEEEIASMFASNIPMECPDKQTAITDLINKTLGQ